MGDQTIADNIVTAKAGTVVAEGKKLALATASGSLTPSTITAMIGIHTGNALTIAPSVSAANLALFNKVAALKTTGTNDPTLELAGTLTANIGDYLVKDYQFYFSNSVAIVANITANIGDYITQSSSGANAIVITGNNSVNTLSLTFLTSNIFVANATINNAAPWAGNIYVNNINANVYPTSREYFSNARILANVVYSTDTSVDPSANISYVSIRYEAGSNIFVLGSGNLTVLDVSNIANITVSNAYPTSIRYPGDATFANISESTLSSLKSLQDKILPSGNHAAFGAFLNQATAHIGDATDLQNTTNFISGSNFGDFGSGITNMQSLTDQGLTGKFGSLSAAGAALSSSGSMFDGIDPKNIGSPAGLVQALNNNKLGNASGVNAKLAAAGVNLNDLTNPVYANKIAQVTGSIKDPAVLNTVADQFGQTPFGGLPSYTGSDSSLYNNSASKLLGGA